METPSASNPNLNTRAPGPRGQFLLGSLPERRRDPLGLFLRSALEYGDVVRFRMAMRTVYLISGPEAIHHVLVTNQSNYIKGYGYDKMARLLGNGLFNSEGDFWRRQRKLAQPAFHRQKLAALVGTMATCTRDMLQDWEARFARSGGDPLNPAAQFDLHREMMTLTLRIASLTLLGTDLSNSASEVGQALTRMIYDANQAILSLFDIKGMMGGTPRYRRDKALLDGLVYGVIEERRRMPEDKRPHDLLSMLMEARDEETGESMSNVQLRDEVMTFFIAGHETTANALSWSWYLLSKHPDHAAALAREASSALGEDGSASFEDVMKLPYAQAVISESMRLFPPAWILSRENLTEDKIGGFSIEPHSIVVVCPYALHHHPKYWENPEGFDPGRFLNEEAQSRHRLTYLPFGAGPRICIGSVFALTEAKLAMAMIARRFHVDLVPGHQIEADPVITLRPKHGIPVALRKRASIH